VSYVVIVCSHALDRADERWPGEKLFVGTIKREVLAALRDGHVSARRPPTFRSGSSGRVLYTWTTDGRRAHVLKASTQAFRVVTLLSSSPKKAAA
jgi:hypothetical protein